MSKIWSSEASAIISALAVVVFFGLLTSHWMLAILITLTGYILWLYNRLRRLEKWISRGTKTSKVYDDNGFVGIIIRHLYQQKKINNERKKRTKDILGRLNRNISALPDAAVLLNEFHQIEWCNEPARYLLAINIRNDAGQRITNLIRHPDFLKYLNDPESRPCLEIESHDDHSVTLQLKLVRFGNNQYLLTARNISDQKQLQEGLKNFVANASHELKSPLTVISGHLEMLEAESGLSESGLKSLHTAQSQSARMKDLIEDLLLLSQVESYHLQPDEGERLSLEVVMTEVISGLDNASGLDRVQFQTPDDLDLLGVGSEVRGICTNLIENALKYSSPASPIIVDWKENNQGELVFSVADQGPGISDQDIPHLTERYYRGGHVIVSQQSGSGLGLSIVEQAASKHGAELEIESKPGEGSRFSVIFPSYRRLGKEHNLAPVIRLADY
ncbi:MAG: phosphate regulon sensor protein PhoR [Gammaproteobacteria bacterium]|nr:phosphate regulon sensor protein PhoR [Gammaproteobacteria bacterium]